MAPTIRQAEGLAHIVEHLVFRSLPGDGKRPLWDVLKRTGASFNASTSADLTSYYAIAHKDRLPELLQLEAWRLTHTLDGVSDADFETERGVVENELRQRYETTIGSRTFDELFARLYPKGHSLSRPIAGTHTSLAAATLADARDFAAAHYRPETCTIVIAGDVSADEVAKLLGKWPAEALFGPQGPSGPKVLHRLLDRQPAPPPPPVSTTLAPIEAPVTEPLLLVAWSVPGAQRGDDAVLEFAASTLRLALMLGLRSEFDDELLSSSVNATSTVQGSNHVRAGPAAPGRERPAGAERIRRRR